MKSLYFSIDVDYVRGSEEGVLKLIEFSNKYKLQTSFFITGLFAIKYPEVVKKIAENDFDIGIHGWDHGSNNSGENFRTNSLDEQRWRVRKTICAIEDITGRKPLMNRTPNLWVSEKTLQVLEDEGITLDSSVPARRLLGRIRSFKYLFAPMASYNPSRKNLAKKGDSSILEVPPAAFLMPINLSSLRMLGLNGLRPFIKAYSLFNSSLLFYGHPAEYVEFEKLKFDWPVVKRHANNIGPHIFHETERFLDYLKNLGYAPARLSDLLR